MLFELNQHYLVKVGRYSKKYLLKNKKQLDNAIKKQKHDENIYISKYPISKIIKTVILDFDSKSKVKAWNDAYRLHKYLIRRKINSVIVDSTNKGYHVYIQIPPTDFNIANGGKIFNEFVANLIHYKFDTLDSVNTNAGLNGNIRLLNSIHPKTQMKVKIVEGSFIKKNIENYYSKCNDYINDIFEESKTYYHIKEKEKRKKWKQVKIDETDIIANNDLRILLPQIYGGEVKKFDGYIAMTCFAHNDQKPSMMVKKSHYWCTACGEKGNIWTLIKKHKSIKYDEVK